MKPTEHSAACSAAKLFRRTNTMVVVATLFGIVATPSVGHGASKDAGGPSPSSAPAGAAPGAGIRPAGERSLGVRERPTVRKRTQRAEKAQQGIQLSLRIPERLRRVFGAALERRIDGDVRDTRRLRREAMSLLEAFLRDADPTAAEMPEALLRAAELEWEEARDRFVAAFQRWEATPTDQRGNPPVPEYARPRARVRRVLQQYKSYADYDLALYVDGFLASEEGKTEESLGRFEKIIEWFPKSRFVPDAHMMRAEYEFTKSAPDYETAYREYERVLEFKDSELYDLALFKSAWTLWRLGKSEEAARRFLTVFKSTNERSSPARAGSAKKSQRELDELQSEALKNLVAVFVEDEQNRAEDMHRFLVQAGGDKFAARIVKALAEAFYDQAHYERGVEAYRLLIKLEPVSPEAYKYALAIAEAHSTMEAWAALEQDYRAIVKEYLPPSAAGTGAGSQSKASAWVSVQSSATLARASAAIERQLREDAIGLHAKAQADKTSRAEFEGAARLYGVYLSRFQAGPQAYETYFNLAEIQFYRLENASEAAAAYLAAVRLDPKGPLSRNALYNALAALEVARAAEFESDRKANRKSSETPNDKKITEAMELYVKNYPGDAQIPELLFRQGKLYYDYQVFDPAVRQWGLLLEKYPNHAYAGTAGELILDSFNKSRDYTNIETWARRLKTAPQFQTAAQQQRLEALIVGAVFKQGEQLAESGEHAKAAAAYVRAAAEFPREERAAQAAVNAEVEAKRAGDLATLQRAVELLLKHHKNRSETAQGLWIAATTHQEVGLFSEAANYHARIAEGFPKFQNHKDAAFNAVLLRTSIGEHDKAIDSGEKFKKDYARDEAADDVTFLMGKAHEKAGKKSEAAALYENYAKSARSPSGQIESLVRLSMVSTEERTRSQALERAIHVYSTHKSQLDGRGKYHAAQARYLQGQAFLEKFEAVKIEGDVQKLKERLRKKSDLLKKAADAFLATAELGVAEWTTAALYQIGNTYESFSRALLTSPPPEKLGAEEKELYKQSLEEFVIPIEERSLEAYESGWQKAIELGIFNAWTAKMREALGRLNAELYPPLKETGFELRSRGPMPLPALIDAPRRDRSGRSERYLIQTGESAANASEAP